MKRLITALVVTLALPLALPGPARAELAPWDQEAVTQTAAELTEATRTLRASLRQAPPLTVGQPGRKSFFRLRDQLHSIEATSRRLHIHLKNGEGREETYPIFRRMIVTVRDAGRELTRIPDTKTTNEQIDVVASLLRKLRTFYEAEPIL